MPRPQVDDRAPVDVDGEGSAHLGASGEDLGERLSHPLEAGLTEPLNGSAAIVPLDRRHGGDSCRSGPSGKGMVVQRTGSGALPRKRGEVSVVLPAGILPAEAERAQATPRGARQGKARIRGV